MGHSTVAFAIAGSRRFAITPRTKEWERVVTYCEELGVTTAQVTHIPERSEVALPCNSKVPGKIDFVFVDGLHKFPQAMIDFYYCERRLVVGGIMGIDDTRLPSVGVLDEFVCGEDEWELIEAINDTKFYRKLSEPDRNVDWKAQNFNRRENWQDQPRRSAFGAFLKKMFNRERVSRE